MDGHPIVHVDLSAGDPEAAGKFYSQLFGWNLHKDEASNYLMFDAQGGPGGGFVQPTSQGQGNNWGRGSVLIYVNANDIEGTLARAEELGGKTIVPTVDMGPNGAYAVFEDPSGTQVGLYRGPQQ